MKNTTELRNETIEIFKQLKERKIDIQTAKTFVALSNAMMKTASVEMEHKKLTGGKKLIQFLDTP